MKEKKILKGSSVSLQEVVRGMIDFSCNANMEYLIELLGLENINRNIPALGLTEHETIYPFYPCLLIPSSLMKTYNGLSQTEKIAEAKKELKGMSAEQFRNLAMQEHQNLKNDVNGTYKKAADIEKWYDREFDEMNSDRMVASTSRDYGILLSKINSDHYFSKKVKGYLSKVMEDPMHSEKNKERFLHLGFKGGSTNYILNSAIYSVDKEGNSMEIALFTNNLSVKDMEILTKNVNEFLNCALTSENFRGEIVNDLK